MKLFRVSSVLHHFRDDKHGYENIVVDWYRDGKPNPPLEYERLVSGYESLEPMERLYAEQRLEEFFTEDELDRLQTYLHDINGEDGFRLSSDSAISFRRERIELPIYADAIPFHALPVGGLTERFLLHERQDFDLAFRVEGYFNLSNRPFPEKLEASVEYLRRAMQSIGNDAGVKLERIEEAASRLYDRDRLYVRKDVTPLESVNRIEFTE